MITNTREHFGRQRDGGGALINPLQILWQLLNELHPLKEQNDSWIARADRAMQADGELEALLHRSTIAYLARRLVTAAQQVRRKHVAHERAWELFHTDLRAFLETHTSYTTADQERLHSFLAECVRHGEKHPPPGLKRRLLQPSGDDYCAVCRRALQWEAGHYLEATLDHVWPRSLGGGNEEENLLLVCGDCNRRKADRMNGSDFHFESFSFKVVGHGDDSFGTEVNRLVRIAVTLEHDCECAGSREDEQCTGELTLARRDPSDSWHFINMLPYCELHNPELKHDRH